MIKASSRVFIDKTGQRRVAFTILRQNKNVSYYVNPDFDLNNIGLTYKQSDWVYEFLKSETPLTDYCAFVMPKATQIQEMPADVVYVSPDTNLLGKRMTPTEANELNQGLQSIRQKLTSLLKRIPAQTTSEYESWWNELQELAPY